MTLDRSQPPRPVLARVAQLEEPPPCKRQVARSIRAVGAKSMNREAAGCGRQTFTLRRWVRSPYGSPDDAGRLLVARSVSYADATQVRFLLLQPDKQAAPARVVRCGNRPQRLGGTGTRTRSMQWNIGRVAQGSGLLSRGCASGPLVRIQHVPPQVSRCSSAGRARGLGP